MKIDTGFIDNLVAQAKTQKANKAIAERIVPLLDLTNLDETDDAQIIKALCEQAITPVGPVAAVCVYPKFVKWVSTHLKDRGIHIATVANFPAGNSELGTVLNEIKSAVQDGANEIDVVFPYTRFLAHDETTAMQFIKACKTATGPRIILKVILETGAIQDLNLIAQASEIALAGGADFIKTSTGKIPVGATLPAAAVILMTIQQSQIKLHRQFGFKAAGGIKNTAFAASFLYLADNILSPSWPSTKTFRLGASSLLVDLYDKLAS